MNDANQSSNISLGRSSTRHTRLFLIAFYLIAVVWGIRNIRYWEPSRLDFVFQIASAISLGWWAIVDARRRLHPIPVLAKPWFFLLAGLVVPVYVLWSRGWRGLGFLFLHVLLWIVITTVVMLTGGIAIYGDTWLKGFAE